LTNRLTGSICHFAGTLNPKFYHQLFAQHKLYTFDNYTQIVSCRLSQTAWSMSKVWL